MSYIYATRFTKENYKLTTSYGNAAQAKKYGGDTATLWEGLKFFDLNQVKFVADATDHIVRSRMVGNSDETAPTGKFYLYGLDNDRLIDTGLRFQTYGDANSTMKALIGVYKELIVLEKTSSTSNTQTDEDPF